MMRDSITVGSLETKNEIEDRSVIELEGLVLQGKLPGRLDC